MRAAQWPLMVLAALAAGCATETKTPPPPPPAKSQSPAPAAAAAPKKVTAQPVARYNLAGYSPAFKQGYADACASRRDEQRFKSDAQYQMGWSDGKSLCRGR